MLAVKKTCYTIQENKLRCSERTSFAKHYIKDIKKKPWIGIKLWEWNICKTRLKSFYLLAITYANWKITLNHVTLRCMFKQHTTWWGLNLIEKKSSRIAESWFVYLRACSSIIYSQQNPKTEPLWEKSLNLFWRGEFAS